MDSTAAMRGGTGWSTWCRRFETGLFGSESDYRVPDQLFCREEQLSYRGAEGAELVAEVRSAGDETYDKIE